MSAAMLSEAAERLFKLPVENTEHAHAEKSELHFTIKILADAWPVAPAPARDMRTIETGLVVTKQRCGVREVRVETRIKRRAA